MSMTIKDEDLKCILETGITLDQVKKGVAVLELVNAVEILTGRNIIEEVFNLITEKEAPCVSTSPEEQASSEAT